MPRPDRFPLSPAQRQAAADLPWYRAWLHRRDEPKPSSTQPPTSTRYWRMWPPPATPRSSEVPLPPEPPDDLGFLNSLVETDQYRRVYLAYAVHLRGERARWPTRSLVDPTSRSRRRPSSSATRRLNAANAASACAQVAQPFAASPDNPPEPSSLP
jgi:hypothetical protein